MQEAVVYLHDIRDNSDGLCGANLGNADLLPDIEKYLLKSGAKVLTADDGYRSVRKLVPLIEKTGTRLILFLTTGFLDRSVFPYEVIVSNMIAALPKFHVFGQDFDTRGDPQAREAAFARAHKELKPQTHKQRGRLLKRLAKENDTTPDKFVSDVFLSWDEAQELARHPQIEIGAHSHRHLHLPSVGKTVQFYEIAMPRYRLARKLNVPVKRLAYPYGGESERVRSIARASGYTEAFGTVATTTDLFVRSRITLSDAQKRLQT
jgi:peptidoglycan/xylan/chitin deacetylase (PgdA/CDA1 family)